MLLTPYFYRLESLWIRCTISNHAYFLIAELIPSTNGPLLEVKSSRCPVSVWATRPPRVSRGPPRAAGREDPCFLRATSYVLATPLLCITPPWWSCPRLPPIWSGRVQSTAGRRDELGTTWDHLGNTRTNKVCPPTGIKCPGGLRDRQCQQWLSVNQSQCLKAAFLDPKNHFRGSISIRFAVSLGFISCIYSSWGDFEHG